MLLTISDEILEYYGRFATKIPDALSGRAGHFYMASPALGFRLIGENM
jgi:hypothetical protein